MAIKVSLENNILKIDDGVKIEYFNSAWVTMDFSSDTVYLRDASKASSIHLNAKYPILFTEFQDGDSTPYATEATIATYLSDKIG